MKFVLTLNVSDRNYSKIKINICWIFKLLKRRLSLWTFQIKLTRLPDISAQKLPKNLSKTSTKALFFGLIFLLTDGATIVRKKNILFLRMLTIILLPIYIIFCIFNFKNIKKLLECTIKWELCNSWDN